MFPGAGAVVYRNEAGEVLGWDMPAEPWYCDQCGYCHAPGTLTCPFDDSYEEGDDF